MRALLPYQNLTVELSPRLLKPNTAIMQAVAFYGTEIVEYKIEAEAGLSPVGSQEKVLHITLVLC